MRIEIQDQQGRFDDQTRAYAEYRVFSRLAHLSAEISHITVTLSSLAPHPAGRPEAFCSIAMAGEDGAAEFSARGAHAYEAIERAAELARQARSHEAALG